MKAYSTDLRERVVAACDAGDATREQIADRFSVSVAWIRKLIRQRRETGSIEPRPHGGGRAPAFDGRARRGSARRSGPTMMPPWRNSAGPPASPAAPRPCTGPSSGWASLVKKVAAGGRAGPRRPEGRAGPPGVRSSRRSTRPAWCSSTSRGRARRWTGPMGGPPAACGSTARSLTGTGR